MKQIIYEKYGEPDQVLKVVERAPLRPEANEVIIKLEAAPVHLADLKGVTGQPWFRHVTLPAVPGYEGVGAISALGTGVDPSLLGKRVFLPVGYGAWSQETRASATGLWFPPQNISSEQLALIPINLPTAYLMLTTYGAMNRGDWVIQN
ncbi:MAG: alcohol dehydrogenase catalytic domain-containing protein, partial [Rhodospirillaceae bacterium]|nr:alcohol dehydrogenase catalytic domain-containing protein [Rhodospirillaceae bacterium]